MPSELLTLLRAAALAACAATSMTTAARAQPAEPPRSLLAQAQKKEPAKTEPAAPKGGAAPAAQQPAAQQLQVPPGEVLLLMIRASIIAVDQANKTNNYSVLRNLGGPALQALTPEKLSEHFADMRGKQIDLSATLVMQPQLVRPPVITSENILNLAGIFPTQPLQVQFEINMQPDAGVWRLAGMTINAVPAPQAAAPAAAKEPAKDAEPTAKGKKK